MLVPFAFCYPSRLFDRVLQTPLKQWALDLLDEILALPGMTLLPIPQDLVTRWTALLRQYPVTEAKVFDTQLVANMLGNGVTRIYTFNTTDFQGFPGIQVLTP